MKVTLTILALFAVFLVSDGSLIRVDVQLEKKNFGLIYGVFRIMFTYNSTTHKYDEFEFSKRYLTNGEHFTGYLNSPMDFEDIHEYYVYWKLPGRNRRYFPTYIWLESVQFMPSERTQDGKRIDHPEKSKLMCTRNHKVIDQEHVELHPCDEEDD